MLHHLTLGEGLIRFGELKLTFPGGSLHPNLPFSYLMLFSAAWSLQVLLTRLSLIPDIINKWMGNQPRSPRGCRDRPF